MSQQSGGEQPATDHISLFRLTVTFQFRTLSIFAGSRVSSFNPFQGPLENILFQPSSEGVITRSKSLVGHAGLQLVCNKAHLTFFEFFRSNCLDVLHSASCFWWQDISNTLFCTSTKLLVSKWMICTVDSGTVSSADAKFIKPRIYSVWSRHVLPMMTMRSQVLTGNSGQRLTKAWQQSMRTGVAIKNSFPKGGIHLSSRWPGCCAPSWLHSVQLMISYSSCKCLGSLCHPDLVDGFVWNTIACFWSGFLYSSFP